MITSARLFIAAECTRSISAMPVESITYVASGCHNNVKVASGVYACGNVYKAVVLLAGISLHTVDGLSETCVCKKNKGMATACSLTTADVLYIRTVCLYLS